MLFLVTSGRKKEGKKAGCPFPRILSVDFFITVTKATRGRPVGDPIAFGAQKMQKNHRVIKESRKCNLVHFRGYIGAFVQLGSLAPSYCFAIAQY